MTDWEKQLSRRTAAIKRGEGARKQDVAAARLAGHSFRDIGKWADLNHETVRKICLEVNGHTRPQADLEGQDDPTP